MGRKFGLGLASKRRASDQLQLELRYLLEHGMSLREGRLIHFFGGFVGEGGD